MRPTPSPARVLLIGLALLFPACEPVSERLAPDEELVNEARLRFQNLIQRTSTLLDGSTIDVTFDPASRVLSINDAELFGSEVAFSLGSIGFCASEIRIALDPSSPIPQAVVERGGGALEAPLLVTAIATMEFAAPTCGQPVGFLEQRIVMLLDGRFRYSAAQQSFVLSLEGELPRVLFAVGDLEFMVEGDLVLNFDNSLLPTS